MCSLCVQIRCHLLLNMMHRVLLGSRPLFFLVEAYLEGQTEYRAHLYHSLDQYLDTEAIILKDFFTEIIY